MRKVALSIAAFFLLTSLVVAAQLTNVSEPTNVKAGGTLIVELDSGDVEITTGANQIQVDVIGIEQTQVQNLSIEESGQTVRVTYRPDRNLGRGNARFQIDVPVSVNVDVKTAGGDIAISGEQLVGTVSCKTAGGDILLPKMVDGEVTVKTAGGDIIGGVVDGSADVTTAGGDIKFSSSAGKAILRTSGGDIEVGDVGDELEVVTAGGDISLGNVGGSANAKTAGGDIHVGDVAGKADLKTAGGDVSLKSASGPVTAKTAGGDLVLKGLEGSVVGNTSGGDIEAEIAALGSGPSELKTAGGDINLSVFDLSQVKIDARISVHGNWEREVQKLGIFVDGAKLGVNQAVYDSERKEIRATVGSGAYLIEVATSNGLITINGGLR